MVNKSISVTDYRMKLGNAHPNEVIPFAIHDIRQDVLRMRDWAVIVNESLSNSGNLTEDDHLRQLLQAVLAGSENILTVVEALVRYANEYAPPTKISGLDTTQETPSET